MKKKKDDVEEEVDVQKAQNFQEIIDITNQMFMHIVKQIGYDSLSNFYHVSNSQWECLHEKIRFYYACDRDQVIFSDNARPFSCPYDDIVSQKPCKYTGFLVKDKKEGYGMQSYWNGVVKYKGLFENDEPKNPEKFKKWN